MLKDSLFKITSFNDMGGSISAILEMDMGNDIFKGHFPGQPVLPGACMMQIVKEVLEEAVEVSIVLKKANNLKFLTVIDPRQNSVLELHISYVFEEPDIKTTANLIAGEAICFKFQGVFVKV